MLRKIERERQEAQEYCRAKQASLVVEPGLHDRLYMEGVQQRAFREFALSQL